MFDVGLNGREDQKTFVVEFPCESPKGAVLAADMSAVDQLEWVKRLQEKWADNAVSVTVYYRLEELPEIKEWMEANYERSIKSVSFLLHKDHNFPLPPYEECSEDDYLRRAAAIDFSVPLTRAVGGELTVDDCAGGACPIK
jgi:reverse gyrase